jgi:hypothetical protein
VLAASYARLRAAVVQVLELKAGPPGEEIPWDQALDAFRR